MGAVSNVVESVGDFVGDVVETVGDVGQDVIDVVDDAGHWIDDKVNEEIPGGWATVAAATGMYYAPEIAAAMGTEAGTAGAAAGAAEGATGLATLPESVLAADAAFGTGAGSLATDAALAAGAGASGTALGDMAIAGLGEVPVVETFTPSQLAEALSTSTPTTDYLGTQALGDATTGAVGSTATPSVLGEFNAANISNIGIQTPDLSTLGSLGGTAAMDVGTAGLTAEQLANANLAGSIGSNVSSGLGYLGGAESLPSGTAGITGVTSTSILDSVTDIAKNASDLLGGGQQSGSNTAYMLAKGLSGGQESAPIGYNMNQSPFTFTAQQPIQGTYNPQTSPLNISDQTKNLAKLLRNS